MQKILVSLRNSISFRFPPYLAMLIVGHVVVPLVLLANQYGVEPAFQLAFWIPTTIALTLLLLPRCKGAIIHPPDALNKRDNNNFQPRIGLQTGLTMRSVGGRD